MNKYDDASWHTDNLAPDSAEELSGTHIALFLRWCFTKGWAGELLLQEASESEDTRRVAEGSLRATEFLFKYCDGKLIPEFFNEAGKAFAEQYYGERGLYLADYEEHFGHLTYVAPEESHDFDAFSEILEGRYQSGVLTKPWWKFW